MKLIDDFFKVTETLIETDSVKSRIELNEHHFIYQAHFPGNPVTPGVCIVQMATEILQSCRGETLSLKDVAKIRFKQVLLPSDSPWFCFSRLKQEDGMLSVRVKVADDEKEFAELSMKYEVIKAE